MDFEILTDKTIKYSLDNKDMTQFLYEHINDICEVRIFNGARFSPSMFKNQIKLRKVSIEGEVTLSYRCFENCTSLSTIDFNNFAINIEREAFINCEKLDNLLNDENIFNIGRDAFKDTRLFRRPEVKVGVCLLKSTYTKPRLNIADVQVIGYNCFRNNENIISLTVNSTVKLIQEDAFADCSNLEFIKINSNTKIEQGALNNTLWESMQEDLYTIHGVLYKKKDLKSTTITLPNDTVEIPPHLFEADKWIHKVVFNSNLKRIGENAFNSCTNLDSVIINTTFEMTIADNAFSNCINLERVIINCNPTTFGKNVFDNCIKLKSQTIDSISRTDWFRNKKGG